jgi:hypothetical protein
LAARATFRAGIHPGRTALSPQRSVRHEIRLFDSEDLPASERGQTRS